MLLSPLSKSLVIFLESDSISLPFIMLPISLSFELKSLTSNVFLDLPLTIRILSLSIAGLDPLNASKNPITSPATS